MACDPKSIVAYGYDVIAATYFERHGRSVVRVADVRRHVSAEAALVIPVCACRQAARSQRRSPETLAISETPEKRSVLPQRIATMETN